MNLWQKLIEVRKSVPYLKKDNKGFQFQYVSSSQALGSLRSAMDQHGVLLVPKIVSTNVTEKATKKDGSQIFTELNMEFTWINADDPQEQIACPWYGQGLDTGEKGVGKAATYAEKYFMLKFFNIATDKDDPDSFQQKTEAMRPPQPITENQRKTLEAIIGKNGLDRDAIKEYCAKYFGSEHFADLSPKDYGTLIAMVNRKVKAMAKDKSAQETKQETPSA